jgi:hypothetical protein
MGGPPARPVEAEDAPHHDAAVVALVVADRRALEDQRVLMARLRSVRGADHLDELPLGCGEDHGEALCCSRDGRYPVRITTYDGGPGTGLGEGISFDTAWHDVSEERAQQAR